MDAPGRIRNISYDEARRVLFVDFHGGRSFRFLDVDPSIFAELGEAATRDNVFAAKVLAKVGWAELTPLPPRNDP